MKITQRVLMMLLALGGVARADETNPDVYGSFNAFCAQRFGAAHEPLVGETFGPDMKTVPNTQWSHTSENSAAVAFTTTLPAVTHIEYGVGEAFDQKTPATERAFYVHLHHLKGLQPGKTYAYRVVAADEAGTRTVLHQDRVTPAKIKNAVRIPDDVKGTPYNLTEAGKTYVLTRDIVADSNAINIMAPDITLDLNGFTITYDNVTGADPGPEKGFGHFGMLGPHAVRSNYGAKGAKVFNGTIVQGKGNSGEHSQPIYSTSIDEIAGVHVRYAGSQLTGIRGGGNVHHNTVLDAGTHLTDRHMGIAAIGSASKVRHNLVKRARQRGIVGVSGGEYRGNEVYVDSYATNSFAIMFYKQQNAVCADNRLFGTGYHVLGVGTVSAGVSKIRVENNFIHLEAVSPVGRSSEYGDQSEAECVRVTWGGEDIQYLNNVMIAKAEAGGEASGIWHYSQAGGQRDVVYKGNTIKVLRADDRPSDKLEGAIRICGDGKEPHVPVLIEGNTVISDFCNVRLGDGYGVGSNARFVGNTFVRTGSQANYVTIQAGHANKRTKGHLFEATKFKDGAGFDKVRWTGTGERGFSVVAENGERAEFTP